MVGMNFNGVVKGNELRLVAQEIFKKAKAKPVVAESESAAIKKNPFSGTAKKAEFTPQETKSAKTGFEQAKVHMNQDTQKSVNSLAAIDKYSNLAFRSQGEIAQDSALELPMPEFMQAASTEQAKKNPLLTLLFALFENNKEMKEEDGMKIMFAAATATKK